MNRRRTTIARWLAAGVICGSLAAPAGDQHIDILLWDDGGTVGVGEYDYLVARDNRMQIARFNNGYTVIGTTGYSDSAEFTFSFIAVPEPSTAMMSLLAIAGLARHHR
ncbi:MAG: hypothetical protein AAGJ46_02355 [Planctomycetota bacterium]